MLVNQDIIIKWSKRTKKWYESKGYNFTKYGDNFNVNVNDLSSGYYNNVLVQCDFCGKIFPQKYNMYIRSQKKSKSNLCCCSNCKGKKISYTHENKIKNLNKLNTYKKVLSGELKNFPDKFFVNISEDEIKEIILYLVNIFKKENLFIDYNDLPKIFTQSILIKYKLYSLENKFGVYRLLNIAFPNKYMPWEFCRVPSHYWEDENNIKLAINWLINKLIEDKIISDKKDLIKIKLKKYLIKYNLKKILHLFNNCQYKLLNFHFPNEFNEWDFSVPKNYYKDDNNKLKIMKWFVKQLINNKEINSIEEIPNKVTYQMFFKYNIGSFFTYCFKKSIYDSFNFIYPNKWNPWQFKFITRNFWENGKNIRLAFDWFVNKLIEDKIINSIHDLPRLPIDTLLRKYGLSTLCYKIEDLGFILSFTFPDIFNTQDFNKKNISTDGIRLDSKEEMIIHEYFIRNFLNTKYLTNNKNNKWFNVDENEYYIPDWIINKDIIVEYFGLYDENSKNNILFEYKAKMFRKIKYFSKLKDYKFIALFPSDLNNNLQGVKEKFNKFIA